jgi:hypothetical protein
MVLYAAMTGLAEAADEVFTHADLKDLWDGIMDDVTKLTRNLLGPTLKAAPKGKRGPLKKLWAELLDALRAAGPARIDQRGFVAHDGPSPVKEVWDRFWEAVSEVVREAEPISGETVELERKDNDAEAKVFSGQLILCGQKKSALGPGFQRRIHGITNLLEGKRFGHHVVDQEVQIVGALFFVGVAGHHQHPRRRVVLGDLQRQRDAVHDRHDDVGEDQIEGLALKRRQRVRAVGNRFHLVAAIGKGPGNEGANGLVVFGDQNIRHGSPYALNRVTLAET